MNISHIMKRTSVFLILLLSFFLSSCTSAFNFSSDSLKSDITKIEIINLSDYEGTLFPDDEKDYEVLLTLIDVQKDNFIEDFTLLEYKRFYGSPNSSPKGICLKFYFNDETYAFITHYTYLHFDKDGSSYVSTQNIHTAESEFLALINRYTD